MNTITEGTRVRIVKDIDNYPDCYIDAGETGVVVSFDRTPDDTNAAPFTDAIAVWVRLDARHQELDRWNNEVQIWNWDDAPAGTFIERIGQAYIVDGGIK